MKIAILTAAISLFAFSAAPALAASDHMHMNMNHDMAKPMAGAAMTEGTVKKIDKATGKVTLAHGPLENLSMPAMTMAFPVKNAASLDQFKVGDKVRFRAEPVNGAITVVAIEAAK